jgi:ABC-type phosphate transport system substrate-binding protein
VTINYQVIGSGAGIQQLTSTERTEVYITGRFG